MSDTKMGCLLLCNSHYYFLLTQIHNNKSSALKAVSVTPSIVPPHTYAQHYAVTKITS